MKSKYIFILLIFFNCIPNYYHSFNRNSCHYQKMHFNPEISNCSKALQKSLPIIKTAYKNNEFDSLNAFLEMWKHTCVDYSCMNMLKMLINVNLKKPVDKQFDSSFIGILRFHIFNYLDIKKQYYNNDYEYYYVHNMNTISRWVKEQFCNLASKMDTSALDFPLLLYLGGEPSNGIRKALYDTTYQQSTFSKIVKREFDQLKGIKIIVPNQYQTFEQALSVCKDQDTIFIKNGRYKINSTIKKQIYIIGENKNKTIITGKYKHPCIRLEEYVVLKNLKFECSTNPILNINVFGEISNCIFDKNSEGIVSFIGLPKISNCIFVNNHKAITLLSSRTVKNPISNNIFDNNRVAINCFDRTEVKIQLNIFYKNNIDVKFGKTANGHVTNANFILLYANNYFGSKKKANKKVLNETKSLNVEPVFVNPDKPQYNYSFVQTSPFKGVNNENEIIGIYRNEDAAEDNN